MLARPARSVSSGVVVPTTWPPRSTVIVSHTDDRLPQLVGDEDDRRALVGELAQHLEQLVGLGRREHRRRFVEDQDVGLPVERLEDLDALLGADRKVLDQRARVDDEPVLADSSRIRSAAAPVSSRPACDVSSPSMMFSATVNTGTSWKCWWTMPTPRLMASPGSWRWTDLALDQDLALVGLVQPEQHLDQRALAGAVLAEQPEDLATLAPGSRRRRWPAPSGSASSGAGPRSPAVPARSHRTRYSFTYGLPAAAGGRTRPANRASTTMTST